ncbi:MAG TPA: hypothetical protein VFB25_06565 [Gaiellaceae bacterium]|nr:hypothetical protein [Gaiellaceae bacterium]
MRLIAVGVSVALAGILVAAGLGARAASQAAACTGKQVTLLNNTNGDFVGNGGGAPTFSTKGKPYCVTYIQTYHWNGGNGQAPGTLGLRRVVGVAGYAKKVGPFQAQASAGQGNAPNVNWYVNSPPIPPDTEINGTYSCVDSSPGTWSSDAASGGLGFCIVQGVLAPCKCISLAVKLAPSLFTKPRLRADQQGFGIGFQWTMGCNGGKGKCDGTVYIEPPEVLAGSVPVPRSTIHLDVHELSVSCTAKCGGVSSGRAAVQMTSTGQLNKLFGRTLAFRIITVCWRKKTSQTVKVFIDQTGRFRPAP